MSSHVSMFGGSSTINHQCGEGWQGWINIFQHHHHLCESIHLEVLRYDGHIESKYCPSFVILVCHNIWGKESKFQHQWDMFLPRSQFWGLNTCNCMSQILSLIRIRNSFVKIQIFSVAFHYIYFYFSSWTLLNNAHLSSRDQKTLRTMNCCRENIFFDWDCSDQPSESWSW